MLFQLINAGVKSISINFLFETTWKGSFEVEGRQKNLYDIEWTSVRCSTWLVIHRWIGTHNEIMWKSPFCTSLLSLSLARPPQLPTMQKKSLRCGEKNFVCSVMGKTEVKEERQKLKVDRMGYKQRCKDWISAEVAKKKCSGRAREFFVDFSSSFFCLLCLSHRFLFIFLSVFRQW